MISRLLICLKWMGFIMYGMGIIASLSRAAWDKLTSMLKSYTCTWTGE